MPRYLQILPLKRLVLLLLFGIIGVWFSRWEFDAPYVTTEVFQQVYLTDEGLYLKPAVALAKTGSVVTPRDANMATFTTPVHVWLVASAMKIAGMHWTVARWVSIFMSGLALISFWSICRLSVSASVAWLATLAAASNFMFFHSTRLATADPAAMGISLLAVWIWAAHRTSAPGLLVALVAAVTAAWAKPTYAPLLVAIGITECLAAWSIWRKGSLSAALGRIAVLGVGAALQISLLLYAYSEVSQTVSYTHARAEGFTVSFGTGVRQMLDSFVFNMPILPAAIAMLLAALAGFFWQSRERRKELLRDPIVQLFAAWILANTTIVGLFPLQPARYYLPTIFAWTFLAFRIAAWNGAGYSKGYAALLLLANLSVQIPYYHLWLSQKPAQTYVGISRDIARRITGANPGGAKLLAHGLSDWIQLFDPRITALDIGYRGLDAVDPLSDRVDFWRPEYLLVNEDDLWSNSDTLADLKQKSAHFMKDTELLAEYTLLYRNVFPKSSTTKPNLKLYRVRYKEKASAPAQGSGEKPPIYAK